jgi:hypothetical protein
MENGAPTDSSEVKAEQESLLRLFSGAIGWCKNPASHCESTLRVPAETIEISRFASVLVRIVERRAATKQTGMTGGRQLPDPKRT